MTDLLNTLWPFVYLFLTVAAGFFLLTIAGIAKEYVRTKTDKDTTFAWNFVLSYVGTAVQAVSQMFKSRPEGLSDEEWNTLRFDKANDLVIAFATSLGFTITKDLLETIQGAIEAAVKNQKPSPGDALGVPARLMSASTGYYG